MAINHIDHGHPNTPAARAKCRKDMAAGVCTCSKGPRKNADREDGKILIHAPGCPQKFVAVAADAVEAKAERKLAVGAGVVKPAQMTVVPRRRGDGGVIKSMKADAPKTLKRPNTLLPKGVIGNLADMPKMLAYGVRLAWAADLDVRVGDRFNDEEARVVIEADRGTISLVWRDKRPDGIWAIWIKNYDNSKQWKIQSVQEALELMHADAHDAWDENANLIGG